MTSFYVFLGQTAALAIKDPLQIGAAWLAVHFSRNRSWRTKLLWFFSLMLATAALSVAVGALVRDYTTIDFALHFLASTIAFVLDYSIIYGLARVFRYLRADS